MKKNFCLALMLGMILSVSSTVVHATLIHEADYGWYYNDAGASGTKVTQWTPTQSTWSYGDILTTTRKAEVTEKVWNTDELWGNTWDSQRNSNDGMFSWTVYNDWYLNPILSFHVENNGIQALGATAPMGWIFSQDNTYYSWSTNDTTFGIVKGNSLDNMKVWVPTQQWIISYAGIDFAQAGWIGGVNSGIEWRTSHPAVPEPGTMFLLGSLATGLFSFAGLRRRFTK